MRIASLIASSTEIVCALGFEKNLVARSHECDYPHSVTRLPAVSEPKFQPDGTSYEIDQRVKAILQEGLSVYRIHAEKLRALEPEVIITQMQCEVCAVSEKDVEAAVCEWTGRAPRIVSLKPNSLTDIWEDVRRIAAALEVPERGEELIANLRARMDEISRVAQTLEWRPRVAFIEWIEPLMAAGNWAPELIEMAGGVNLFGEAGKHSPWMTFEALQGADPDVILVSPCGFGIARTLEEMPLLAGTPGWSELRAVRERRVFVADGNAYFNRPGPRVVESLEILSEIIHPGLTETRHRNTGWIQAK